MLTRQRIVLALIDGEPGRVISRLKLVKQCFLLAQAWKDAPPAAIYQFLPYKFGPFSFTLYQEIEGLCRAGELEAVSEKELRRVPGTQVVVLEPAARQMVRHVAARCAGLPMSALLDAIYAEHPWFTLNSERVEKRAATLPQAEIAIYTAGYEGLQVDGFLDLLLRNGIRRVVDVRANPISRRYGFHKSTLARLCGLLDLDYVHLPELGIPSAWREQLETVSDYARLFDRYEATILPAATEALDRLGALIIERPTVLVCQEKDAAFCHRRRLAIRLSRQSKLSVSELCAA